MINVSVWNQVRHFVRPDLVPNCLQRLSADDKVDHGRQRVKVLNIAILHVHG